MRKLVIFLTTVMLAISIHKVPNARDLSELIDDTKHAVVLILTYDRHNKLIGLGSGFFASSDGIIVTNYHVIEGCTFIFVTLYNKSLYKVTELLCADSEKDIAILKVDGRELPYLKSGDSDIVQVGEKVIAIGNPEGLDYTVSDGIVSAIRADKKMTLIQTTAPISRGSSGGPLINKRGEVIGITARTREEGQNLNFAIPINYVKELISERHTTLSQKTPDYFYIQGILAKNRKEDEKAIDYFKKATELDKNHLESYLELGGSYFKKRQYQQEIEAFKKAVQIDPNNEDAHYFLAQAYEDIGLFNQAIREYKEVIKLNSKDVEAHHNLAILYLAQNKYNQVMDEYKIIKSLNPGAAKKIKKIIDLIKNE